MNTVRSHQNGSNSFRRVLSLWFGFKLALFPGLDAVLKVALINEPMNTGLYTTQLLAIGAVYVVQWRYPDVRSRTVWAFGLTTGLLSYVLLLFIPGVGMESSSTSGSLYLIVKTSLVLIAALSGGYAVVCTDWQDVVSYIRGSRQS